MHTSNRNKLFFDSNFRSCISTHAIFNLARWISLTTLPLFVAQKFNAGNVLVTSLSLKILPTVICAPIVATILPKIGFKKLAIIAMLLLAVLQLGLPYTNNQIIFQALILSTGIIDTVIVACMLALRTHVIPAGKNIDGNALFSMVESIAKILGPILTMLILWKLSLGQSFYVITLLLVLCTKILSTSDISFEKLTNHHVKKIDYASFLKLFIKKPILWSIYIPSLGYAILIGTRNLFLFWSNKETFQNHESEWTLLLTAHGLGCVLVSILGPKFLHWINKRIFLLKAFLWLGLLRSISFLGLGWITNFKIALPVVAAVAIPEVLETICFFSLLQTYLDIEETSIFYTYNIPVYYLFVVLGTLTGRLYTNGIVTLHSFWALTAVLSILTIVPFLLNPKLLRHKIIRKI